MKHPAVVDEEHVARLQAEFHLQLRLLYHQHVQRTHLQRRELFASNLTLLRSSKRRYR